MNTQEFCYWLQGFFEISGTNNLSKKEVAIIKEHLDLVFNKVTKNPATKLNSLDTKSLDETVKKICSTNDRMPNKYC